jgi:hypothetical protein
MGEPVLVTGGTGFLGRAIIERLLEDDERPKALARSEASAGALAELGAEPVRGDVLDPDALAAAMAAATRLPHCRRQRLLRGPRRCSGQRPGSENVVRVAPPRSKGSCATPSAATSGEKGTRGPEQSPRMFLFRLRALEVQAEQAVLAAADETGIGS